MTSSETQALIARCFHARNGELGVRIEDVDAFLDLCTAKGYTVSGWETWIIDHHWDASPLPAPEPGQWCGLIPVNGSEVLHVIHGSGDIEQCRDQVHTTDFATMIPAQWLPLLRINFTVRA